MQCKERTLRQSYRYAIQSLSHIPLPVSFCEISRCSHCTFDDIRYTAFRLSCPCKLCMGFIAGSFTRTATNGEPSICPPLHFPTVSFFSFLLPDCAFTLWRLPALASGKPG